MMNKYYEIGWLLFFVSIKSSDPREGVKGGV